MRYAYVQNGIVQSVFESDLDMSAFPDLAGRLFTVDQSVQCNWLKYNGSYYAQPEPQPIINEFGEIIDWAKPSVDFGNKRINWSDGVQRADLTKAFFDKVL